MIIKPELFKHNNIKSFQSTRLGGNSKKPYDAMNLGVFGEDNAVSSNVKKFALLHELPHQPVFMQQIHSNQIVEYKSAPKQHGNIKADACFTKQTGVVCCVLTADCLPILIADKQATVVAAVHCGWRGLYSDLLANTLQKINAKPADLQCWLGPCISYKPYRVDEKFREDFVKKDTELSHCFYRNKKGGWHADLKKIAVSQLERLGVRDITQTPYCTHDNKTLFYSYRRDKETGRMASFIWLEKQ